MLTHQILGGIKYVYSYLCEPSMNYQRLHDAIIQNSRISSPVGFKHRNKTMEYKEHHHIIPRCMGGTNDASNLIYLTPRRHFIVHRLLTKIYPTHPGIIYAFQLMFAKTDSLRNSRRSEDPGWLRSVSKSYEQFRILLSEASMGNQNRLGTVQTDETRQKISVSNFGKSKSFEHCSNISKGRLGMKFTEEHKAALRKSRKRQVFTTVTRAKLSAAAKLDWVRRKQSKAIRFGL